MAVDQPEQPTSRIGTASQFGINAIMWVTMVVALTMGYLRRFDSPILFVSAALIVFAACVVGGLIGWPARRVANAVYWSVIISIAAFLSVAGEASAPVLFRYAWSAVGIMTGAACGVVAPGHLWRRILLGSIAGGTTMLVCSATMPVNNVERVFDLICAPIVGALVGLLIELILWLEERRYSPRYVTALWLLCAVIIGNLLVPWVLA